MLILASYQTETYETLFASSGFYTPVFLLLIEF